MSTRTDRTDLAQLLASYEPALVEMADKATSAGATVYFEAPPPRNPAVPVGYDSQKQENQGSQGSRPSHRSMRVWPRRIPATGDTTMRQQSRFIGQPVLDADTAVRGMGRQALH